MKSVSIDNAERSFFEDLQLLLKRDDVSSSEKRKYERICGVDVAYGKDNSAYAVASVLNPGNLKLLERSEYTGKATFPYEPGLFFLREGPFACKVLSKLKVKPDLVCFDAHGYAHPRRLGLATICGMVSGVPSIGISKSKLVGEVEEYKQGLKKLVVGGETLAYVTTNPTRYWSPGYSITFSELESLIESYPDVCLRSINRSHEYAGKLLKKTDTPNLRE